MNTGSLALVFISRIAEISTRNPVWSCRKPGRSEFSPPVFYRMLKDGRPYVNTT
ncbi:hypothetical protein HSR122_1489 [Halapricum desulfuricans]|uniref:Uncharacterized protein n=1 Tax=Halapricum desulfuricans TaxID=2841257 RepID=A0A897N7W6_9EURY|nr:hypothetical protein HSR122_1489 [Halapricum desulfuricans]